MTAVEEERDSAKQKLKKARLRAKKWKARCEQALKLLLHSVPGPKDSRMMHILSVLDGGKVGQYVEPERGHPGTYIYRRVLVSELELVAEKSNNVDRSTPAKDRKTTAAKHKGTRRSTRIARCKGL